MKKPSKPIYMDFAAATPMDPKVVAAMQPYFTEEFYNPSALYLAAKNVHAIVAGARERIAKLLEVRASEIVFAAGSTEANNLAIRGVLSAHTGEELAISAIEHDSVLGSSEGFKTVLLPVSEQGILDVEASVKLITNNTVLVSCMMVNNEIGTIQPFAELAKQIAVIRGERIKSGNSLPLYLHCDASQAFNYMQVLPHVLGADLLVIGGSKVYGPKQTAILYVKAGLRLAPLIVGGGQEYGLRAGTENVAGIVGLSEALEIAHKLRTSEVKRLGELQKYAFELIAKNIPQARINGSLKQRIPNNIHLTIDGTDNETLVMQLDEYGVQIAAGSACSASSEEPSHVLTAMGLSVAAARSSIRITFGRSTTKSQVEYAINTLEHLLHS